MAALQLSLRTFQLAFFFSPLKNREDNIKILISIKLIIFEFRTYIIKSWQINNSGPVIRIYYSPSQCADIIVIIKTFPATNVISLTGEIYNPDKQHSKVIRRQYP